MSDWFKTAPVLQQGTDTPPGNPAEEGQTGPVDTPPAGEGDPTPAPEPTSTNEPPVDPAPADGVDTPPAGEPEPTPFDFGAVIEEHQESISSYLELKRTDFQSMSPESVVERKLRADNPEWSDQDIKGELRDRFGIGLEVIEINEDEMTDDEIRDAKENNRIVERGERLLKSEAKSAREYFENIKNEAKLPEFDFQAPQPAQSVEELEKQYQEQRDSWVSQVDTASKDVSNIVRTIEVDDGENGKVAFTIDYKLSDAQKKQVSEYLYDYMAHPEDVKKYVKEDGSPDLVRFMADKAILNEDILNSMFRSVAKEAMAVARKSVIKNTLLNHDDGVTNRPAVQTGGNSLSDAQNKAWARHRK